MIVPPPSAARATWSARWAKSAERIDGASSIKRLNPGTDRQLCTNFTTQPRPGALFFALKDERTVAGLSRKAFNRRDRRVSTKIAEKRSPRKDRREKIADKPLLPGMRLNVGSPRTRGANSANPAVKVFLESRF